MMFGFGDKGTTNLMTRALAAVGKQLETVPDPTQIHYHLPPGPRHPQGWQVKVWRDYDRFVEDLTAKFPHEREGIRKLYDEFWKVGGSCAAHLGDRDGTGTRSRAPSACLRPPLRMGLLPHLQRPSGPPPPPGPTLSCAIAAWNPAPTPPCTPPCCSGFVALVTASTQLPARHPAGLQRPQLPGAQVAGGAALPAGPVWAQPAGLPHPRLLRGRQHGRRRTQVDQGGSMEWSGMGGMCH
jgi:uncharacterized protein Usg